MNYFSLHHKATPVSFKEAVINGLAPDRGLYFPSHISPLSKEFIDNISAYSNEEIAFEVIKQFVGKTIPETTLKQIISETICFNFPVVNIKDNIGSLELYHGPTLAFKDVGARFMARCLGYFQRNTGKSITVLVATSGDTGGAVANGFLNVNGIEVVILYPSGKVSDIQEKQLTTLGKNITALEVDGTFDDCQEMVKTAFLDKEITKKLTSANSINVARWLPQMFYYFFAYKELHKSHPKIVFSVPSGNFGNICAGLMAKRLGLPIHHFIAATNINDTIPRYMKSGAYHPKASKPTISNAMDVGNPSNFIRIKQLFNHNFKALQDTFSSYAFDDITTKKAMEMIYKETNYITDPHGSVGYLGLKTHQLNHNEYGVFLETAHPIKFLNTVENTLNIKLAVPSIISELIQREKKAIKISSYENLKKILNT